MPDQREPHPNAVKMIECAEYVAVIARRLADQAAVIARSATNVAKAMREENSIPLNDTGWYVASADIDTIARLDGEFNRLWRELRDDAATAARERNART